MEKQASLRGKVAVVTGASYGIGRAMAIGLARRGCNLAIIARNKKGLEETAERVKREGAFIQILKTDLSKPKEVLKVRDKINKVDILYNGVANWVESSLENTSVEKIIETIDTVYKANVLMTKTLFPLLKSSGGIIINMVSDWGLPDFESPSPFGSAKKALAAFGRLLRKEVKEYGIRIINVYPTEVSSPLDIDNTTQETGKIRLSDLIENILDTLQNEKGDELYISHLGEKLEVKYL